MEQPSQIDPIIALGRRLVEELALKPTDTLGRWMAHYIAETMEAASNATAESRASAQLLCFNAIRDLWTCRAGLPPGARPLAELEPILRALKSLDPDSHTSRSYHAEELEFSELDAGAEACEWLEAAGNADNAARQLISYALTKAAASALDSTAEWVKLATAAGLDTAPSEIIVRLSQVGVLGASDRGGRHRFVRERLDRLNRLAKLLDAAMADLNAQLSDPSNP